MWKYVGVWLGTWLCVLSIMQGIPGVDMGGELELVFIWAWTQTGLVGSMGLRSLPAIVGVGSILYGLLGLGLWFLLEGRRPRGSPGLWRRVFLSWFVAQLGIFLLAEALSNWGIINIE